MDRNTFDELTRTIASVSTYPPPLQWDARGAGTRLGCQSAPARCRLGRGQEAVHQRRAEAEEGEAVL